MNRRQEIASSWRISQTIEPPIMHAKTAAVAISTMRYCNPQGATQ